MRSCEYSLVLKSTSRSKSYSYNVLLNALRKKHSLEDKFDVSVLDFVEMMLS